MGAGALNWLILSTLAAIWGGSLTAVAFAADSLPPLTIAAARLFVGAAALLTLAVLLGALPPSPLTMLRAGTEARAARRFWLFAFGAGVASNALPFALLSWALAHVPSGLSGVLMGMLPLIVLPLAAAFVPGERMTLARVLGLLIGFAGVVYLIGVEALQDLGGDAIAVIAQLACLAAAAGYATGSVITKLSPPGHPATFATGALSIGALVMAPLAFAFEVPFSAGWTSANALAVVGLGLLPTAAAMLLLVTLLRRTGPTFVSFVNYQIPLWAIGFGAALLGETIPDRTFSALAIILAGVAVAQGAIPALLSRFRRAPSSDSAAADGRGPHAPRA